MSTYEQLWIVMSNCQIPILEILEILKISTDSIGKNPAFTPLKRPSY
jgi:hypothetical protein